MEILSDIFKKQYVDDISNTLKSHPRRGTKVSVAAISHINICIYLRRLTDSPTKLLKNFLKNGFTLCSRCVSSFLYS